LLGPLAFSDKFWNIERIFLLACRIYKKIGRSHLDKQQHNFGTGAAASRGQA
jgi:hypothetical protein